MKRQRINCRKAVEHLCERLDEGLNSRRCREIRKHLQQCPNCTAYLDSLKKTVFLFRRYPDPRVPGRLRQKLHARLKLRS